MKNKIVKKSIYNKIVCNIKFQSQALDAALCKEIETTSMFSEMPDGQMQTRPIRDANCNYVQPTTATPRNGEDCCRKTMQTVASLHNVGVAAALQRSLVLHYIALQNAGNHA